jgi:hypothetical protein
MEELNHNHDLVITRLEDVKDDMQVCKSNIKSSCCQRKGMFTCWNP